MKRSPIMIRAIVFAVFLFLLMLAEWLRRIEFGSSALQSIQTDLIDVVLLKSTGIFLAISLVIYFAGLLWMTVRERANAAGSIALWKRLTLHDACKIGLVLLAVIACVPGWAGNETGKVSSLKLGIDQTTNALVLLTGIVVGCAAQVFLDAGTRAGRLARQKVLRATLFFLAATCLFQPAVPLAYQYHEAVRWTGLWVNPNIYGLLMGTGLVLALGQMPWERFEWRTWRRTETILLAVAAALCAFGLLKSYSRGAWLATSGALIILFWFRSPRSLRRNLIPIVAVLSAGFVFAFWQFRYTDSSLARRFFSAANRNDFSWRNRVTVWHGSMQMMRDRPLLGFGWGRIESAYTQSYRARRIEESMAIQLNDYFTLATSAGIPALVLFALIAGRVMRRPPERGTSFSAQTSSRSAMILLLIGFWFDGGLFKLATGPLFWILVEFSRTSKSPALSAAQDFHSREKLKNSEIILRIVAISMVIASALWTSIHLIVPRFPATRGREAFAREHLIPPQALVDFDFLTAQPGSRGRRLSELLEQADLANYNRGLVKWKLEDQSYQSFVLSPQISPPFDGDFGWRRLLWEHFYPRIRKMEDLETAAGAVLSELQNQIQINPAGPFSISEIWRSHSADNQGFEVVSVAAWRSVGIPARLNDHNQAEILVSGEWHSIPRPAPSPLLPIQ